MTLNARESMIIAPEDDSCCDETTNFVTERGEIVCQKCGTCKGSYMVLDFKRAYTFDEIKNRRTSETVSFPLGARTIFQTFTDWKGNKLSPARKSKYIQLSKINRSTINGAERNYMDVFPYLRLKASELSIQWDVENLAWKIYKKSHGKRIVAGRSARATVCASLCIACRASGVPRYMKEFIDDNFKKSDLITAMELIVRIVLPDLGLKYRSLQASEIVHYFSNKLKLGIEIKKTAMKIAEDTEKKMVGGKDPKGTVAAAIYLASIKCNRRITQKIVSDACEVTEVTLRNRVKEIIGNDRSFFD